MNKKLLIVGHRGYSEVAPENTSLAFQAAKMFNFDGIEMDLHQTKDKQLVVIHDETIDRTSNGKGYIKDLTLNQLLQFDYNKEFNNLNLPKQNILTYEQFLKAFGNQFKLINVEIKTDIIHYDNIEKNIYAIHQKVKPQAKIIYSSFNFKSLAILHQIDSQLELGFLFVGPKDLKAHEEEVKRICKYLHPWAKSLSKHENIKYYQQFNLPWNVWTVDRRSKVDYWTLNKKNQIKKIINNDNLYSLITNSKY